MLQRTFSSTPFSNYTSNPRSDCVSPPSCLLEPALGRLAQSERNSAIHDSDHTRRYSHFWRSADASSSPAHCNFNIKTQSCASRPPRPHHDKVRSYGNHQPFTAGHEKNCWVESGETVSNYGNRRRTMSEISEHAEGQLLTLSRVRTRYCQQSSLYAQGRPLRRPACCRST